MPRTSGLVGLVKGVPGACHYVTSAERSYDIFSEPASPHVPQAIPCNPDRLKLRLQLLAHKVAQARTSLTDILPVF